MMLSLMRGKNVTLSSILEQYLGTQKPGASKSGRSQCTVRSSAGKVSAFRGLEWQDMVQKNKWDVVRGKNWKSGLLWGKLLPCDFFRSTTERIVADHFTSCENVIRLESLLQMKTIVPDKCYFPLFSLAWDINLQNYLFVIPCLRVIFSSPCGLLLSDHYLLCVTVAHKKNYLLIAGALKGDYNY